MYSDSFCKIYNEFGWNYFPEAFGEQLLLWLSQNKIRIRSSLDLACGTGVLCEILHEQGIDASGMDFSEAMIAIAQERNPEIFYEVADMITYRPEKHFDLVTCTGDALNHILSAGNVQKIFANVYSYLNPGGYFIFDILNENEVSDGDPFDLDYDDHTRAQFRITRDAEGIINLKAQIYEDGRLQTEENIYETLYDPQMICEFLRQSGFQVLQCGDRLLRDSPVHGTTWFLIAKKC